MMSNQQHDPHLQRSDCSKTPSQPSKSQSAPPPSSDSRLLPASDGLSVRHSLSAGPPVLPKHPSQHTQVSTGGPQTIRKSVANDCFRRSHGVDASSDLEAFAGSAPGYNSKQIRTTSSLWARLSYQHESMKILLKYLAVTLPTQIYPFILLRLPSLYFSRVAEITDQVHKDTLPDIRTKALEVALRGGNPLEIEMAFDSLPMYKRLTSTWRCFIDSLMREWKNFNIVSALFLIAILTILQIQNAAEDPLTKATALCSWMCALISLLFGCMYIVRFGPMREATGKGIEWAHEAKRTNTFIFWNARVVLAMPAIWLAWSVLFCIGCIMSFVWRLDWPSTPPGDRTYDTHWSVAVPITTTVLLGIGVVHGFLIITTFRQYGEVMDNAWKTRIEGWIKEGRETQLNLTQASSTTSYGHSHSSTYIRFPPTT